MEVTAEQLQINNDISKSRGKNDPGKKKNLLKSCYVTINYCNLLIIGCPYEACSQGKGE